MTKKLSLAISLIASLVILPSLPSLAFHSGGVGDCEGCHTIHNSSAGQPMTINTTSAFTANKFLLRGSDQSSTCLYCHNQPDSIPSDYHVSTDESALAGGKPPAQLTPGGDFGWLKKTYTWQAEGINNQSSGERHGHNIIAVDFDYRADSTLTSAPGGTYPAEELSCISCHDPHGKFRRNADGTINTDGRPIKASGSYGAVPDSNFAVGVYRLLGGAGYSPVSFASTPFVNEPPAAVSPSQYNRSEASSQTRVSYGRGFSEWCANCHGTIHTTNGSSGQRHPAGNDIKLGKEAATYNAYVKSGDLTGSPSTSYLSLVPFEEGVPDQGIASYSQLASHAKTDDSQLGGPDPAAANVMCLTCHRAHASGFDSIKRFETEYEFMTLADSNNTPQWPNAQSASIPEAGMGRTSLEIQKAYYDMPVAKFSAFQRVLCNKCHAKD